MSEEVDYVEEPFARRGPRRAGPISVILIMAYLVLLAVLLLYSFVQLWPPPTEIAGTVPGQVTLLLWRLSFPSEVHLLILVALAGALGATMQSIRALARYVGYRALVRSWLLQFITMPIVGTMLAVILYVFIRGGFFSPTATMDQASPFGFVASGAVAGMFGELVVGKLREIAEMMFARAPEMGERVEPKEED